MLSHVTIDLLYYAMIDLVKSWIVPCHVLGVVTSFTSWVLWLPSRPGCCDFLHPPIFRHILSTFLCKLNVEALTLKFTIWKILYPWKFHGILNLFSSFFQVSQVSKFSHHGIHCFIYHVGDQIQRRLLSRDTTWRHICRCSSHDLRKNYPQQHAKHLVYHRQCLQFLLWQPLQHLPWNFLPQCCWRVEFIRRNSSHHWPAWLALLLLWRMCEPTVWSASQTRCSQINSWSGLWEASQDQRRRSGVDCWSNMANPVCLPYKLVRNFRSHCYCSGVAKTARTTTTTTTGHISGDDRQMQPVWRRWKVCSPEALGLMITNNQWNVFYFTLFCSLFLSSTKVQKDRTLISSVLGSWLSINLRNVHGNTAPTR